MALVFLFSGGESSTGLQAAKSDKIYRMLSQLLTQGVPIDGVGLQMHISVDIHPDIVGIAANIKRLVRTVSPPPPQSARDGCA